MTAAQRLTHLKRGFNRCDFCWAILTSTSSRFDAGPVRFIGGGFTFHSTGPWAACVNCTPLVRARAWELLLRRLTHQLNRTGRTVGFYAGLAVHSMWTHALAPQLGAELSGGPA